MRRMMVGLVVAAGFWIMTVGSASADDRRILDLLLKKGILTRAEYEEVLKEATQEPAETSKSPVKVESPPPTSATPPPPVGSYKDLELVPGGIENLRKNDYRNVFTTLDSILKHSERINIGLVALKAQYNADSTDRKPSSGMLRDSGFVIARSTATKQSLTLRLISKRDCFALLAMTGG